MFQAARKQMRTVAMLGVAAALVVGGVAAAQGGSQGASSDPQGASDGRAPAGHPAGPPPFGLAMGGLTYAELHVQNEDGAAETVRIDQGKVKSVGSDSITLTENDDSEVTVAVDDDTDVLGKPGQETSLGDLEAGQQVSVSAPDGEAATAIMVLPKKGDVVGMVHGAPGPPPPGAEMGLEQRSGRSPAL